MTIDDVTAIASQALFLIIKCSAPMLLVSLCVGADAYFCAQSTGYFYIADDTWSLDIDSNYRIYAHVMVKFQCVYQIAEG